MARLFSIIKNLLFLSRRTQASSASDSLRIQRTTADNPALKEEASVASEKLARNYKPENERNDVYWMRDPKSGNWIPETHISEVDVDIDAAELRRKFLLKKQG